jgi:hypothetical protein
VSLVEATVDAPEGTPTTATDRSLLNSADVEAKQAPSLLELDGQSYRLVEDYTIRASIFKTGLLPPFDALEDDCEAVLERRTDLLSKQARSTAFVVGTERS